MKTLQEYILINEAWGNFKNYKRELEDLLDKYNKKEESNKNKRAKRGFMGGRLVEAEEILAKYPVQILVDKLGYEPQKFKKYLPNGKQKEAINLFAYGSYLINLINKNEVSMEDLVKWWEEYETEIIKKNWHDPNWIVKQVDGVKLWDPYNPKSMYKINRIIENPENIFQYLKSDARWYSLSREEREIVRNFYADPVNHEALVTAFKGIKRKLEKLRPSFKSAVNNILKDLISEVQVGKRRLGGMLEEEYESNKNRSYYSGSNYTNCEATAILGIVLKTLSEMYGFSIRNNYDNSYSSSGDNENDPKFEKFIDDAPELSITVTDNGSAETKTSGVYSSSFSTYYDHNFTVTVEYYGNKEKTVTKEFKDITVGTNFYSGGWG
jgi:hypothetical protein